MTRIGSFLRGIWMSRFFSSLTWIWLGVALAASHANDAWAELALFRTAAQARQQCPNDTVVWLDFEKNIYYAERQRLYGQGGTGSFVCRKEARKGGYRRSLLGRR